MQFKLTLKSSKAKQKINGYYAVFKRNVPAIRLDLGRLFECLVGYLRKPCFLWSDVCTSVTICLVIRQSGEGCPCQEGGQVTNSFLFSDTSIYQG